MREVLIIVQNLSVPRDRRVWAESKALVAAGFGVAVICPRGEGEASFEEIDGIRIHRYAPPSATEGIATFVWEFIYCWVRALVLAVKIYRKRPFHVIQACNPPDTYFALAWLFRPMGVRFVYDQHDLCPELYLSRFPRPSRILYRGLLLLERLTYRTADHVISTNSSYREIALGRGRLPDDGVTVVRNGPDTGKLKPAGEYEELRRGRPHLCCWVGVMGPQDGVDLLVRAIDHYVHGLGRKDCSFALLGTGDSYRMVRDLVRDLDLEEFTELPGWTGDDELRRYLSTADVGLCADPWSPFNDVSTMNKTMEYMAFGLPMVAFDLKETRVSAAEAALYVRDRTCEAFADAIAALLDDPAERQRMGLAGRERAVGYLDWAHQVPSYVEVYQALLPTPERSQRVLDLRESSSDEPVRAG